MMLFIVPLLTLLCLVGSTGAWDPDAGVSTSWTKMDHVTVTSTSGSNVNNVIDGDDNTNWVSSYCLPGGYMNRDDVNVLKNACHDGNCFMNTNACSSCISATDGSVYTTANINSVTTSGGEHKARFSIRFNPPMKLPIVSFSGIFHDNSTELLVRYNGSTGRQLQKTFLNTDSYKNIEVDVSDPDVLISEINVEADTSFSIKEIAAIGEHGCTEALTVDLGALRDVGIIRTRHWAGTGAAHSVSLMTSADGTAWNTVASLDPEALRPVTTAIKSENVQYISLRYNVNLRNYQKVYCYEIDAWDANGIWGPKIPVRPNTKTLRDILGVNGIWGWGHNAYSDAGVHGVGPQLYNAVASHVRNYHNLIWDVTDPDNDPGFSTMATHGTQAMSWLNWDTEYAAWVASNLKVDASIQFLAKSFPESVWNNPENAAFQYGREFAKHFGADIGNGLVEAIEVGNEPWDYTASFYATVLKGMSSGVRSVDSSMVILPGAFQAESITETNTYIGTRVLPEVAANMSAINCHSYSFLNDHNGVRRGVHPEHAQSSFNNIRPICRWRDTNMPGKPVWLTEWGWDSSGQGEQCSFPECVTEQAQAVYGVRGLAILARSSIERATWFFYANLDHNSLFGRSGLTASLDTNFVKKTVFVMFEELLQHMGDVYFLGVLQETEDAYVYLFSKQQHQQVTSNLVPLASHILAWYPADIADTRTVPYTLQLPYTRPNRGWRFVGHSTMNHTEFIPQSQFIVDGYTLHLELSPFPILVELTHTQDVVPVG